MSIQQCSPQRIAKGDFGAAAGLFKALGDPHRLSILATLADARDDEVCVCDFTAGLPLNQPTVSHHLRILKEAGLVTCERRGTWVYYRIAPGVSQRLGDALGTIFPAKVTAA